MKLIYRILYRVHRWGTGLRAWVGRRLTPAGLIVLTTLILAGLFGPDTENNVAYQGFMVLLALLAVSVSFMGSFRARFEGERTLPPFGTVGVPLRYQLSLKNATRRQQKGISITEMPADPRPSFEEWYGWRMDLEQRLRPFRLGARSSGHDPFKQATLAEFKMPPIAPGQALDLALELTPLRRGVLRLAGLTLARSDPLGLCRSFCRVGLPQSVLVLPKRYPVPPLAMPGTLKYQEGGVALASSVGQSDEFVALRDYRRGDPPRHIHWRSWAKTGTPVVKEFEDEFFVRHALVLDTFTKRPHSEVFEEAVSVAASFACTVQTQESLLDLLFVGPHSYCFTAGRGVGHLDQLLEVLAAVRPCADQAFAALEQLVLSHLDAVSGCICVLLAWDEARQEFLRKLRALGVPVRVLVLTEAGGAKAIEPGVMADDPEHFHVLEAGNIEQGLAGLK